MPVKNHVLLGVTGGIAAYKIPNLCSRLVKGGFQVETILTANAQKIVSPIPFESLSGNRCHTDTFDPMDTSKVEHIALAREADLLVIAPASANIIAKLRWGLADDLLSTTALACTCPKLLVPAMNTNMYCGSGAISSWSRCPAIWPAAQWVREKCPSRTTSMTGSRPFSPVRRIFRAFGFSSPPAPPRSPWIRCAISPTIPAAKWAMPSPTRPCSGARM